MPKYLYRCTACTNEHTLFRSVHVRRHAVTCPTCGQPAHFAFTSKFQLITQPERLSDQNKFALGFSEQERTETKKADDATYEANWAGADMSPRATTTAAALERTPLNALFPQF